METKGCPVCHAKILLGVRVPSEYQNEVVAIRTGKSIPNSEIHVRYTPRFRCCVSCGHVWTAVAPDQLKAYILAYGDELLKQSLTPIDIKEIDGLPPDAVNAIRIVSEIDSLMMMEKVLEAKRRYYSVMSQTWDQVHEVFKVWRALTRAQKLTLCGWPQKTKPEDAEEWLNHPLRDALLDG